MARGGVVFREVDRGWNALRATVQLLKDQGSHVKVGVLDGSAKGGDSRGDLTNAELASVLEYGTADGHIPPRPFVGGTFDAKRSEWMEFIARLLPKVYEGKIGLPLLLEALGAKAANDIKRTITSGDGVPPPNAPSTIARKGSARPLVDTGRLVDSISWLVVLLSGKE